MMSCEHLVDLEPVEPGSVDGCEDCLRIGGTWVHLRFCMTCGHVGCCDSSPHKHATRHFHTAGHGVVHSFEPGERWVYCYIDEDVVADAGERIDRSHR